MDRINDKRKIHEDDKKSSKKLSLTNFMNGKDTVRVELPLRTTEISITGILTTAPLGRRS